MAASALTTAEMRQNYLDTPALVGVLWKELLKNWGTTARELQK